jgi:hypothetical protein
MAMQFIENLLLKVKLVVQNMLFKAHRLRKAFFCVSPNIVYAIENQQYVHDPGSLLESIAHEKHKKIVAKLSHFVWNCYFVYMSVVV